MSALFSLILLLAPLSLRAQEPSPCREFGKLGCFFIPDSVKPGASADLLIYLRGHLNGSGVIAAEARVASARQAFTRYGLKAAGQGQGAAILVTGSSDVGVGPEDVAALQEASGRRFARLLLAAHSGGYVGLTKTLDRFGKVDRIVMLDDFYFASDLSRKIQKHIMGGAACTGYYTAHNKSRQAERFAPLVYCPLEPHDDYGHDDAVAKCLPSYLVKTSCP